MALLIVEKGVEPEEDGFHADYEFLAQASCRRIGRTADGFAGHEKFHPPVLLPAGGITVRRYGQSVAEACRGRHG